jgi:intein/homing endonuclease
LEDGTLVNISEMQTGQMLKSLNTDTMNEGTVSVTRVVEGLSQEIYEIGISAEIFQVTREHPFLVQGQGWVKARNIAEGMSLMIVGGETARVLSIERVVYENPVKIYSISVEHPNTYVVGKSGVVVHNK